MFHSCSGGLTSFHPLPPTSILQTVCSNKTIGKDLFLSKPSLWGCGSRARPVCGNSLGVSMAGRVTTSLLYLFRFLCSGCSASLITTVWTISVLQCGTSRLSPLWLIYFTSICMPHSRASRWTREMPHPRDFCFSDLILSISGMWNWGSDWQSHL